jgi:hypothetical protein
MKNTWDDTSFFVLFFTRHLLSMRLFSALKKQEINLLFYNRIKMVESEPINQRLTGRDTKNDLKRALKVCFSSTNKS